jgi:long-chain acyl-CoA synthetase
MNVAARFEETAQRYGDRVAINDESGEYTFGAVLTAARAVAGQVVAATERERVAVLAPTSAAFAIGYLGVLLADRVAVPLNFLLDPRDLRELADDADVDTVVASRAFSRLVPAIGLQPVYVESAAETPPCLPAPERGPDECATLLYTSGTTGRPKGVILTHRNLVRNVETCHEHVGIRDDEVILGFLPFFHSFGLTASLLIPMLHGCRAVYIARFSPQRVLAAAERHGVTACFAVASMYRALLREGVRTSPDLGALRLAAAGGEALGSDLAAAFEDTFGVPLFEGYGLTETSPIVAVNTPGQHRPGSVGRVLPWVSAQVVDDLERPIAQGGEGELWLRGDCITPGYHNRPEETAAALTDDRWLRTGDLARIDDDGYLWITGRKKDLIISGGENVWPGEIEAVLAGHPAVFEAAVIGVPDPSRGEVPKAFVVLMEGAKADAADLAAHCRERLPRYKIPAHFEFLDELPKSHTGKVRKLDLRRAEGLCE